MMQQEGHLLLTICALEKMALRELLQARVKVNVYAGSTQQALRKELAVCCS